MDYTFWVLAPNICFDLALLWSSDVGWGCVILFSDYVMILWNQNKLWDWLTIRAIKKASKFKKCSPYEYWIPTAPLDSCIKNVPTKCRLFKKLNNFCVHEMLHHWSPKCLPPKYYTHLKKIESFKIPASWHQC